MVGWETNDLLFLTIISASILIDSVSSHELKKTKNKKTVNPTVAAKKLTKLDLDWIAIICHHPHFVFVYTYCYNCPRKCYLL